jgi:hypothetical protein
MSQNDLVRLGSTTGIPLQHRDYEASSMLRAYFWYEIGRVRFDNAMNEWSSFFVRTRQMFEDEALEAEDALRQWTQHTSDTAIALVYKSTQHDEEIEREQFFQDILPKLVGEERAEQIGSLYSEKFAALQIV